MLETADKEQLEQLITAKFNTFKRELEQKIHELDVPDTRNLATKKMLTDSLTEFKNGMNTEIVALQEAVKKVAEETDTKIKQLTPPKTKPWWGTILDYQD